MADALSTFVIPRYSGAQAAADYAQREAERHRVVVREIWQRGFRWPGEVAAELNRLGALHRSGRPWTTGSAADLLRRLRFDRKATERQEAEALEGVVEELWSEGTRTRPALVDALIRRSIPPIGGGRWTPGKVATLLEYVKGEWMLDGAPRLRRGDGMLTIEGVPALAAVQPIPVTKPQTAKVAARLPVAEPQEARPRRRAVRIS